MQTTVYYNWGQNNFFFLFCEALLYWQVGLSTLQQKLLKYN
jgi:hypothetical protein